MRQWQGIKGPEARVDICSTGHRGQCRDSIEGTEIVQDMSSLL